MPDSSSAPAPKPRRFTCGGCALRFTIGSVALVLVVCLAGWISFSWRAVGYRRELALQEQRVRDAGEPLNGDELNQWYSQIPEGVADLTPKYLAVLASLPDKDHEPDFTGIPGLDPAADDAPLSGEPWPEIASSEEFLARYEQTFSLLAEAASQEGVVRYPLDFREGMNLDLEHAQQLRSLSRLCCLRAQVLCHRGDHAGATDALVNLLLAAETLRDEPVTITQMLRNAIHTITAETVSALCADPQFPAEQLERLQEALGKVDLESAARMGALGERASTIDQIISSTPQQLGRKENGDLTLATTGRFRDVRPGDCALLLQLATDAVESCRGDYPGIWQQQQAFSQNVETVLRKEGIAVLPWERKTLTLLLLPGYRAVFAAAARGVAQHRATLALLACERFRRERGDYPRQLADVTPAYLPEVPSDPFTGEPLRLQHDKRFIIYSVGQDGNDDGGDVDLTRHLPPDIGLAVPPYRKVKTGER